jgi:hypothetical protein
MSNCNAHARRKFHEVQFSNSKWANHPVGLAGSVKEQTPKITTPRSPSGKALVYFPERERQFG